MREPPPRRIGEVLAVTALTWLASLLVLKFGSVFFQRQTTIVLLATAPLIYFPLTVVLYRQEPLVPYGITLSHPGRAVGLTVLLAILVLPLFALGFQVYRQGLLQLDAFSDDPSRAVWFKWLSSTPQAWLWLLRALCWQFMFVALPEECFYRGYLQGRLNACFPGRRRLLGSEVGVALPVSAGVFALHHVLMLPLPERLLVFFPALLFGWLREATGSLLAPGLFHAMCNLVVLLLTTTPPLSG